MANVSTVDQTDEDLIPIGKLGDADTFRIPSAGAFTVCKECDHTGRAPWVSSINTTREIYIKGVDGDTIAAMKRLEVAMQPVRPN